MTDDTVQALANCLDVLEQPDMTLEECVRPYADQAEALIELLALAQTLRLAPDVTPSLDFRVDARQHLLARLPVRRSRWANFADHFRVRRWSVSWLGLMRVAFILLVGVVLGTSVVVASAQALPNDVLYPVKRTVEQVRLTFASDAAASGELHLVFATERLNEVQRLIEQGRGAEAAIALDDFAVHMQSAATITQSMPDTAQRTNLQARVAESRQLSDALLSRTQSQLPESAQPAVSRARAVLAGWPDDDAQKIQPLVGPLISTITSPDRTVIPHATAMPSSLLPSTARNTPGWMPTQVEPHSNNLPNAWPTVWPTLQPFGAQSLKPHAARTQTPLAHPTYLPRPSPTLVPPVLPHSTPSMLPQLPLPFRTFRWPGPGSRH